MFNKTGIAFSVAIALSVASGAFAAPMQEVPTSHPNIAALTARRTGRFFMSRHLASHQRSCGRLINRVVRRASINQGEAHRAIRIRGIKR
jgi:hypothetical protein